MNVLINDTRAGLTADAPVLTRRACLSALRAAPAGRQTCSDEVAAMERVYQCEGGLESGDTITLRLRDHHVDQPISTLARWIVSRCVVNFASRSQTLLPLFQFDMSTMSLRPGVSEVTRELSTVFDDQAIAMWFARPNRRLNGAMPLDAVVHDQPAVMRAAQADKTWALAS